MAYLTDEQILEMTEGSLEGGFAWVVRGGSRECYKLLDFRANGQKGVVWRATDDVGSPVALKLIPSTEYIDHSLIDEMTHARNLDPNYFARIWSFGDLEIKDKQFSTSYKAVVTEWVEGIPFDEFARSNALVGEEFILLARQLFTALAVLRNGGLCHDDLHPGNILIQRVSDPLTNESTLAIKVIDTGSIKRIETRDLLLARLRDNIRLLQESRADPDILQRLKSLLDWKEPDDHLRAVGCLLEAANSLARNYHRLQFWERSFCDQLLAFFLKATDEDLGRRLDAPDRVVSEMRVIAQDSKAEENKEHKGAFSPFDYISAEMIRNDREFAELFSGECPWLDRCRELEPLYIYGPRGCGKSSVLRWLSFKTFHSDPSRNDLSAIKDIGVYVSCSVELRSRFWLLNEETIEKLQLPIIRFFNLILLEELFDTLREMWRIEESGGYLFGFKAGNLHDFALFVVGRLTTNEHQQPRLQGQTYFDYLKSFVRKLRWDTWTKIQRAETEIGVPDPAAASDICRGLADYFGYFQTRHVTFLIDDYSNQRIPSYLQKKLNQTISFAKQGTPIFKVSSEYDGVDLEGIQEGREVVEVNVGQEYTMLNDANGARFLTDIINIRLRKAKFRIADIEQILGSKAYENLPVAIAEETEDKPLYYSGIDCIHWLCSGDVALALDLIKRIFDDYSVSVVKVGPIPPQSQHRTIQQFSYDEVRRINSIVPDGDEMHDIVCYLGYIARATVMHKKSRRDDKNKTGKPLCMTHLDVRVPVIKELHETEPALAKRYDRLTSRAILFSLQTSRSRIQGALERLQMRRIYFPAFKAPLKRDTPIKIDDLGELVSLLSDPRTFAERELSKAGLERNNLVSALGDALAKPRTAHKS